MMLDLLHLLCHKLLLNLLLLRQWPWSAFPRGISSLAREVARTISRLPEAPPVLQTARKSVKWFVALSMVLPKGSTSLANTTAAAMAEVATVHLPGLADVCQ